MADEEKEKRIEETARAEHEKVHREKETIRANNEQKKAKNAKIVAIVTSVTGVGVFVASGGAGTCFRGAKRCCQ